MLMKSLIFFVDALNSYGHLCQYSIHIDDRTWFLTFLYESVQVWASLSKFVRVLTSL